CRENQSDSVGPQFAKVKPNRDLTLTGAGNGHGVVTAPTYGESGSLECSISGGTYNPIDCTKTYGWKTSVELTATPSAGSQFTGWSGACNGTASTCKVVMTQARSVRATFSGAGTPSFTLNVVGGGDGSGTITSQAGLSPAISCTVTAGSVVGTGCSAVYLQGIAVTLTATAASGNSFSGWSGDCSGTGTCSLVLSANRSATGGFAAPLGIEATMGKWAASQLTPVVAVHLSQLPNGKALLWGHGGEPQLWHGPGAGFTEVPNSNCTNAGGCDLFCSGHAFLANGRLLVAGGHNEVLGDNNGVTQASIFDGTSWQATGSMAAGRWYPTLVTLENGDVLAISGNKEPGVNANIVERYNAATGSWSPLSGTGAITVSLYSRAFVEPKNGWVFVAGEGTSRYLNPTGSGSWSTAPGRVVADRGYGNAVMLDSKVLYIGGGGASGCPSNLPKNSAEIIDLAAATPAWSLLTATMQIGRRQAVATILADGKVLVTGGTSQCGFSTETGAIFAAEMWDPATGQWTQQANAGVVRVYHSTAVLLPDGRVLSTGSGEGANVSHQKNYEVFSPPYLFKGARPTYNLARTDMHYGQPFTVVTPNAAQIRKVHLIRLAASTHAFDMGQRLNTVAFQAAADGQSLTLTPPASGRIAPPGPYFLFILNDKGVPSVAQTILLSP
ncbi:MAG TPA: galactose oxidase-like domain-containing protein, partial [Gemmatimonadales bacterium]